MYSDIKWYLVLAVLCCYCWDKPCTLFRVGRSLNDHPLCGWTYWLSGAFQVFLEWMPAHFLCMRSKSEHLALDITNLMFVTPMSLTLFFSGDPKQRDGHVHRSGLQFSFKIGCFTELIYHVQHWTSPDWNAGSILFTESFLVAGPREGKFMLVLVKWQLATMPSICWR